MTDKSSTNNPVDILRDLCEQAGGVVDEERFKEAKESLDKNGEGVRCFDHILNLEHLIAGARFAIHGLLNPTNYERYREGKIAIIDYETAAFEFLEATGGVKEPE